MSKPRIFLLATALSATLLTHASAQGWGRYTPPAPPTTPAAPPATPASPEPPANPAPTPTDAAPPAAPTPTTPAAPPPEPAPPPPPVPATTPPPPPPPTQPTPPPPEPERHYDYYGRMNGLGIFHMGRLALGATTPTATRVGMDGTTLTEEALTSFNVYFDVAWLGVPSLYGNFHGVESGMGYRSLDNEFFLHAGFPFTVLNVGRGQVASLRLGGSFGAGYSTLHWYGYLTGRAAMVIIPEKLDVEGSVRWIPEAASNGGDYAGGLEEINGRVSAWYRYGKGERAVEFFVEYYERDRRGFAPLAMGMAEGVQQKANELKGLGAGVGITLF